MDVDALLNECQKEIKPEPTDISKYLAECNIQDNKRD